jgi:hypothetical protein
MDILWMELDENEILLRALKVKVLFYVIREPHEKFMLGLRLEFFHAGSCCGVNILIEKNKKEETLDNI